MAGYLIYLSIINIYVILFLNEE